jgi:hypothetical protein
MRTNHGEPPHDVSGSRSTAWLWLLAVLVLAALAFVAVRQVLHVMARSQQAAVEAISGLGESFRTATITTTFTAALPRFAPDDSLKLELAAVEAVETFTRSDDRRIFYDLLPLGTTVSEIRVPVTYRYHLRLDDPWRLEVAEHTCVVLAPPIRPTLPPAIDTAGLAKRSSADWLRFDEAERMDELERELSELLSRRAGDPDTIDLVRETCRRRVAEFVRGWLLAEDQWRADGFRSIVVTFADEQPVDASSQPATLSLEPGR